MKTPLPVLLTYVPYILPSKNYILIDASCILYTQILPKIYCICTFIYFTNFSFLALIMFEWNILFCSCIFFVSERNLFVWLLRKIVIEGLFTTSKWKADSAISGAKLHFRLGLGCGGLLRLRDFKPQKILIFYRMKLSRYCSFLSTSGHRLAYITKDISIVENSIVPFPFLLL